MHNGNIKNNKSIIINFIIYSATLLWLLTYDFLKYFLYLYNINIKNDIAIGISIKLFTMIIMLISFIINHVKSLKTKFLIIFLYLCFSTYTFFPHNPYKWLYFSFGTFFYFYFLYTFISFLSLKKTKEILGVLFIFISIFILILVVILFFWKELISLYLCFLLKYLIIGCLLILLLSIFLSKLRCFIKKYKNK